MPIQTFLPGVVPRNPLNGSQGTTRGSMLAAARRGKAERNEAFLVTFAALRSRDWPRKGVDARLRLRVLITLTLCKSQGRPRDDEGLIASLKHVRDGVADALGIDDGDRRLRFSYAEEKVSRFKRGVRIEVREQSEGEET